MSAKVPSPLTPPPLAPRILILGIGNPGRQDDGLGPALAQAIGAAGHAGVTCFDNDQLTPEDAIEITAHEIVWFVDAAREGPAPFQARPLAPALSFSFTSHLLPPEALLALAQAQFGARPQAYLLAIRGEAFDFAEGLTAAATRNLEAALAFLQGRLTGLAGADLAREVS